MNNFNIIEKDDLIIGYSQDLIKYLKNEIHRLVDDSTIEDDYFIDIFHLIRELQNKDNFTLLKVAPCQMGGYTLEELEA